MQTQRPLAVVTAALDGDLLAVLVQAEGVSFTTGQVQRMLAVPDQNRSRSLPVVRAALQRLATQGTVLVNTDAPVPTYQFNGSHLAAPAIRDLTRLRSLLVQRIEDTVERWPVRPVYGALFGSAARGQMRETSDVDILLIRPDGTDEDQWDGQVHALARDVRTWTGNPAEILSFAVSDVRAPGTEAVLTDVVREGMRITGDVTWLSRELRAVGGAR